MSKVEYTYNEFTGKLWAEDFTTFCTALRDLCGLDVDPSKSHVVLSSFYQEYFLDGELQGVDKDGMSAFLTQQGIENDPLVTGIGYGSWTLKLTNTEGVSEKYDSLIEASMKPQTVEQIVESVFEQPEEDIEVVEEVLHEVDEVSEVESDQVIETVEVAEPPAEPDFEYAKTLMEGDDEAASMKALQDYADQFGIKLGGKAPKGRYLSFTNKWAKMQKEAKD